MSHYELLSTLSIEGSSDAPLHEFAEALKSAFGAVGPNFPAMVAYLVKEDLENGDIQVGIRFDGVNERYADDFATEILENVIDIANREIESPSRLDLDSSLLTPA